MKRSSALPAIAASLLLAASFACEEQREPDRIVGVMLRCASGSGPLKVELSGGECDPHKPVYDRHLVITVRTHGGTTYNVESLPEREARVGDPWPPDIQR